MQNNKCVGAALVAAPDLVAALDLVAAPDQQVFQIFDTPVKAATKVQIGV